MYGTAYYNSARYIKFTLPIIFQKQIECNISILRSMYCRAGRYVQNILSIIALKNIIWHSDVGSEFGVKNMKAWIIRPCLNGSGWWCNGVGDIFLAHLVPIEYRLNTTVYLSIVADHVHPFMTTVFTSSDVLTAG